MKLPLRALKPQKLYRDFFSVYFFLKSINISLGPYLFLFADRRLITDIRDSLIFFPVYPFGGSSLPGSGRRFTVGIPIVLPNRFPCITVPFIP